MAPAAFRRHRERGGRAPLSSSSLTSSLDGRRVSPLVLGLHGVGGASPSEIGSVSLSLSVSTFRSAALSPFHIYMEILNSDWTETFAMIFLPKNSFLAAEEGHQPPYGWPTRVRGAPRGQACPLPHGHLGHHLAWIVLPEFSKYSKNKLRPFLSRLDSVWYGYSAKHKTCNKQELALGTGSIC